MSVCGVLGGGGVECLQNHQQLYGMNANTRENNRLNGVLVIKWRVGG